MTLLRRLLYRHKQRHFIQNSWKAVKLGDDVTQIQFYILKCNKCPKWADNTNNKEIRQNDVLRSHLVCKFHLRWLVQCSQKRVKCKLFHIDFFFYDFVKFHFLKRNSLNIVLWNFILIYSMFDDRLGWLIFAMFMSENVVSIENYIILNKFLSDFCCKY